MQSVADEFGVHVNQLRSWRNEILATGEGWLYVAALKDMTTREIVSWTMNKHLLAELSERASLMAIKTNSGNLSHGRSPLG